MTLEFFIAKKYFKSRKKQKFISFTILVAIISISLGVLTLITVLSVMNGFQKTVKEKILDTGFHIYISPRGFQKVMQNYDEVVNEIKKMKIAEVVTPFFKNQVLIKSGFRRIMAIDIMGIEKDLNLKDKSFNRCVKIIGGTFNLEKEHILIGSELAKYLNLWVGDKVEIISPYGGKIKIRGYFAPVMKTYTIAGIFKTGYYEYDLKLAFISLKSAQNLFNQPHSAWGIGLKIKNIFSAPYLAKILREYFNNRYIVFTWIDLNRNLFTALKNEKTMLTFIVFLIVIVASFGISSALVMLVMEKRKEIAILKTMGVSSGKITGIFLLVGMITGFTGIIIGTTGGLLLSHYLNEFFALIENIVNFFLHIWYKIMINFTYVEYPAPFHIIAKDVYYFEKLPVETNPREVAGIIIGTIIICFLSSLIPARQAARLKPMEVIRYE